MSLFSKRDKASMSSRGRLKSIITQGVSGTQPPPSHLAEAIDSYVNKLTVDAERKDITISIEKNELIFYKLDKIVLIIPKINIFSKVAEVDIDNKKEAITVYVIPGNKTHIYLVVFQNNTILNLSLEYTISYPDNSEKGYRFPIPLKINYTELENSNGEEKKRIYIKTKEIGALYIDESEDSFTIKFYDLSEETINKKYFKKGRMAYRNYILHYDCYISDTLSFHLDSDEIGLHP